MSLLAAIAATMGGGPMVQLTNGTWTRSSIGTPFVVGFRLAADGIAKANADELSYGSYTDTGDGDWLLRGSASDYEVRVAVTGAALDVGSSTADGSTWTSLGTDQTWEQTALANETTDSSTLTIDIRHAITQTLLVTGAVVTIVSTND